ncbi:uncharacterized protein LOC113954591 [Corapipo altera]|uniref:uncharacterized protein LOC113954591 n=1 Tax=Corapipo altera TaxID=415028 RepID=UPI000FD62C0B|nr:uncharacterized protein LOC113954591 [Corapipo altera]
MSQGHSPAPFPSPGGPSQQQPVQARAGCAAPHLQGSSSEFVPPPRSVAAASGCAPGAFRPPPELRDQGCLESRRGREYRAGGREAVDVSRGTQRRSRGQGRSAAGREPSELLGGAGKAESPRESTGDRIPSREKRGETSVQLAKPKSSPKKEDYQEGNLPHIRHGRGETWSYIKGSEEWCLLSALGSTQFFLPAGSIIIQSKRLDSTN